MADLRRRKGAGDNGENSASLKQEDAEVEHKRSTRIDQTFTTAIMLLSGLIAASSIAVTVFPDSGPSVSLLKGSYSLHVTLFVLFNYLFLVWLYSRTLMPVNYEGVQCILRDL